jgi:hypothetical protein
MGHAETLDALVTPISADGLQGCRASDLKILAGAEGVGGSVLFMVEITNFGRTACYLQGPPDIKLVDETGQLLDINYQSGCFLCKAGTEGLLFAKVGIRPKQAVYTTMSWRNWCNPFPQKGVQIRLTLPDGLGEVVGPTDAYHGARCDDDSGVGKSGVGVSQYSHKP